jgi:hypothetical protein
MFGKVLWLEMWELTILVGVTVVVLVGASH